MTCRWIHPYSGEPCSCAIGIDEKRLCILHSDNNNKDIRMFEAELMRLSALIDQGNTLSLVGVIFPSPFSNFASFIRRKINTDFSNSVFKGKANFEQVYFDGVSFQDVLFEDEVSFEKANFKYKCSFLRTTFKKRTNFNKAIFELENDAVFKSAIFEDLALFKGVFFNIADGFANFNQCTFNNYVSFGGFKKKGLSRFECNISFNNAFFANGFSLSYSEFSDSVIFSNSIIRFVNKPINIDCAAFRGNISFYNAMVDCPFYINESIFVELINMADSNFAEDIIIIKTRIEKGMTLRNSVFVKSISFNNCLFGKASEVRKLDLPISQLLKREPYYDFRNIRVKEKFVFEKSEIYYPMLFDSSYINKVNMLGFRTHNQISFKEVEIGLGGLLVGSWGQNEDIDSEFRDGCNFHKISISGDACFHNAIFCNSEKNTLVSFKEALFNGNTSFVKCIFRKGLSFEYANFLRQVKIIEVQFPNQGSSYYVLLKGTFFASPQSVNISDVNFDSVKLLECHPSTLNIQLSGVTWAKIGKRRKRECLYEETIYKDIFGNKYIPMVSEVLIFKKRVNKEKIIYETNIIKKLYSIYQRLKVNFKEGGDFYQAGIFHVGEMETRAKIALYQGKMFDNLILKVYKLSSYYGERWLRASFALFVIITAMAIIFLLSTNVSVDGIQYRYLITPAKSISDVESFFQDLFKEAYPIVLKKIQFMNSDDGINTERSDEQKRFYFRSKSWQNYYLILLRILIGIQFIIVILSLKRYFHR